MPYNQSSGLLKPFLKRIFSGQLRKMRPDAATGQLALEIRKPETRQTFFQVIDTISGKSILPDFTADEKWEVGLQEISAGHLLLQGFTQQERSAEKTGLEAIEISTGKRKWQNPGLTFLGLISEVELLAFNESNRLVKANLLSGEPELFPVPLADAKEKIEAFQKIRNQEVQFPESILPVDSRYPNLQKFIKQHTGLETSQTIEHKETSQASVLSFYTEKDSVLAKFLLVCALDGEVKLRICLESQASEIDLDTFFIFAEKLFFIQEKSVLNGYLL